MRATGAVDIFISGREQADYSAFGYPVLEDKFSNAGPLAGIERGLAACTSRLLLVLAVDLPEMKAEFLRALMASRLEMLGSIPRVNGNLEPLAAFYPKAAHCLAESLLRDRLNAVAIFAGRCVLSGLARFAELPDSEARHFTNWNTPADFPVAAVER